MQKIAVMQPYFLPYLGYFQLIGSVDTFVLFDDVQFIKRGWIHRNRVLHRGEAHLFTIPVESVNQQTLIQDVRICDDGKWGKKLLQLIQHSYSKAPQFEALYPVIVDIINYDEPLLSRFIGNSLKKICGLLGISTEFRYSSEFKKADGLKGEEKILALCKSLGATTYINAEGGRELYRGTTFQEQGVELSFLEMQPHQYTQFQNTFVPSLSILDVLMFNDTARISELMNYKELRAAA